MSTKELFHKSADTRTSPIRENHVFQSIEDEYRALEYLHELMPDLVAEPIEIYRDEDPVTFSLERIDGPRLQYLLEEGDTKGFNADHIVGQLEDVKETIENARYPHGDLQPWNVMLDQGSNIKIIDPVGYPRDFSQIYGERAEEYQREAIEQDMYDISKIQEKLQKLI